MTSEVIEKDGAERTVRHTVTNYGPLEAYSGDNTFPDDPPSQLYLAFQVYGATLLSTSIPCEDNPGLTNSGVDRRCAIGDSLAVGASRSVDVRVRVTEYDGSFIGSTTGYRKVHHDPAYRSATEDPNPDNDISRVYWGQPCRLKARTPQRLADALKVQVVGGTEGCYAKVKSIRYKVGNRVFSYIGKKPQRRVAAGEVWRLSYPIKGDFRTIVARALRANKTVLGKMTVDLDGASDYVIVRIK